jgi:hypothetical protein
MYDFIVQFQSCVQWPDAEWPGISMAGFASLSHVQIFSFVDKPPVNHWLI